MVLVLKLEQVSLAYFGHVKHLWNLLAMICNNALSAKISIEHCLHFSKEIDKWTWNSSNRLSFASQELKGKTLKKTRTCKSVPYGIYKQNWKSSRRKWNSLCTFWAGWTQADSPETSDGLSCWGRDEASSIVHSSYTFLNHLLDLSWNYYDTMHSFLKQMPFCIFLPVRHCPTRMNLWMCSRWRLTTL